MSFAMFSIQIVPSVDLPPANGSGGLITGGGSGPPSSRPPSVYESYEPLLLNTWVYTRTVSRLTPKDTIVLTALKSTPAFASVEFPERGPQMGETAR